MIPRPLSTMVAIVSLILTLFPAAMMAAPSVEEVNRVTEDARRELMAPCCWKDTLLNHSSPRSDELSQEVRALAEAGQSKEEILDTFAERYGETILASPRTEGLGLLFYIVPALLLLITGIWLGVRILPKLAQPAPPAPGPQAPRAPASGAALDALFEDELKGKEA